MTIAQQRNKTKQKKKKKKKEKEGCEGDGERKNIEQALCYYTLHAFNC